MSDEILDMLDGFLKSAQSKLKPRSPDGFQKWKQCIALTKLGWKAIECKKQENNIVITWQKEGQENIIISLSFIEQRLWFDYLKRSENGKIK